VCLVKGAPGAGVFYVPEFIEDTVEKKGGRTAFSIVDYPDDALAQEIEADLGQNVFVGHAVLVLDLFDPFEDVFLERALVDGIVFKMLS